MSGHDENEHVRDTGPSHAGVKMKDFNIIWNAAIEAAAKIALAEANLFASGKYIVTKIEGLKK